MEKIPYDDCFKWFKSTYAEYGIVNIEMCTELDKKINLNDYSAIFIGGGNTFKLINEMRKTGFDKKIIDYIKMMVLFMAVLQEQLFLVKVLILLYMQIKTI